MDLVHDTMNRALSGWLPKTTGINALNSGLFKLHLEGKGTGVDLDVIVVICYVKTPKTIVMILSTHTPESSSKYERQFDRIVRSFSAIRSRSLRKPFILGQGLQLNYAHALLCERLTCQNEYIDININANNDRDVSVQNLCGVTHPHIPLVYKND